MSKIDELKTYNMKDSRKLIHPCFDDYYGEDDGEYYELGNETIFENGEGIKNCEKLDDCIHKHNSGTWETCASGKKNKWNKFH